MNLKTLTDNELVTLAQQKNQNAVEELMERYKYVPASVARSYFLIGGAKEDLLQEGMIGVYRAISTFDTSKAEFKTYVYTCVKNSILSCIKKSKTKKNQPLNEYVSLSGYVEGDSDKSFIIQDNKLGPEELFIHRESENELNEIVKKILTKTEYEIFQCYIKGDTYSQISEQTKRSIKSVDNAIQRIKKKIRELLLK